jgi:hypothetical protein
VCSSHSGLVLYCKYADSVLLLLLLLLLTVCMQCQQVQKSLAGMKKYEIPRKWELLEEGFTKERGMMTPKMSVKRHIVMKVSSVSCMHDIPSTS